MTKAAVFAVLLSNLLPAIAIAKPGHFTGVCRLEREFPINSATLPFSVPVGREADLGFYTDSGEDLIKVVNDGAGHLVGFALVKANASQTARVLPVPPSPDGEQRFRNPPDLCPTAPVSEGKECALSNALLEQFGEGLVGISHTAFVDSASTHSLAGLTLKDPFDASRTVQASAPLSAGATSIVTPTFVVEGLSIGCTGHLE